MKQAGDANKVLLCIAFQGIAVRFCCFSSFSAWTELCEVHVSEFELTGLGDSMGKQSQDYAIMGLNALPEINSAQSGEFDLGC